MSVNLEDRNSAGRTSNATLHMQWRAREEERIALQAPALLAQLLKIPHLTNWHSPMHKDPLVKAPPIRELWRPCLESNGIANESCKVLVVEPSNCVFVGLDADGVAVVAGTRFALCFIRVVTVKVSTNHLITAISFKNLLPPDVSRPNHQYITLL